VRVSDGRVSVLQLAGTDDDALHALLAGARSLGDILVFLNLPEGHPAGAVLAQLGGRLEIAQHEMALKLER
jgi:hypothetical protein